MKINNEEMNKVKELLETLYTDFEVQATYLETRKDVSWDCYDKDNWINLCDIVSEISNNLGIKLYYDNNEVLNEK